jgi:AraC-like DNA-binding protein
LQRVAKECGYSRNQISYLLNQVLGQSFYRYVNQARLQHLLRSLDNATPPLRIDELAFAAGFNSLSAFYSCFRQHTGQSPKAYVKQISLRDTRARLLLSPRTRIDAIEAFQWRSLACRRGALSVCGWINSTSR